jgi:hypothetical protein
VNKRELVDRIKAIEDEIREHARVVEDRTLKMRHLDEERAVLREILRDQWPDGEEALASIDSEPPITEPGTPRTKSSQRMAAVKLDPCDACGGTGRVPLFADLVVADGESHDCAACGGRGVRQPAKS